MSLRIRQIVLVARELEPTVAALEHVLGLRVAFRDPGVGEFGLCNAVMPIGDQFLEVISPTRAGTAAGRLLERSGDGGYMILLQTDDLDRDRARLDRLGVRVIWSAAHDDIRALHLHPKDIGGAIVSLDQPMPPDSWRWAGSNWRNGVATNGAKRVLDAEIEAADPAAMARRWSQVLGLGDAAEEGGAYKVAVGDGAVRFVKAGARGEGLGAFTLAIASPQTALKAARSRNLPTAENTMSLGGVRFALTTTP